MARGKLRITLPFLIVRFRLSVFCRSCFAYPMDIAEVRRSCMGDMSRLNSLVAAYNAAPTEYRATKYWQPYENQILQLIPQMDMTKMRSGRYPILATFGFHDVVYYYHPNVSFWKKALRRLLGEKVIGSRSLLPYWLNLADIREMAFRHCRLLGELTGARPIDSIEMSTFGAPSDIFEIEGRRYSMAFLNYYVRYCFAQRWIGLTGEEVFVELGPGSGYQIEIFKKLMPDATVYCFDLPGQIYLCETYLTQALGPENIIGTEETLTWHDLRHSRKGAVHFLGSWQFPLLRELKFDVFWNAASFGEMEPEVVRNYLSYVLGNATWVYLLQASHGKETTGKSHVRKATTFDDYAEALIGYQLVACSDAYLAHKRLTEAGGYFEAVWTRDFPRSI